MSHHTDSTPSIHRASCYGRASQRSWLIATLAAALSPVAFTIEAMKMETTITASRDLTIKQVVLTEGTLVESDDLVLEVE